MPKNKISSLEKANHERQTFETIDDLVRRAEELFTGLRRLSQTKYPLDIRRGVRKEVDEAMSGSENSTQIKAGNRTYFFDVKKTREGKPYLIITESRFKVEGGERERSSIMVFPENADEFSKVISQMTGKLQ